MTQKNTKNPIQQIRQDVHRLVDQHVDQFKKRFDDYLDHVEQKLKGHQASKPKPVDTIPFPAASTPASPVTPSPDSYAVAESQSTADCNLQAFFAKLKAD